MPSDVGSTQKRPPGRRSGDGDTRTAILAAAREQFANEGYDGASLRTIAATADVDPGMIRHFFGSKDDLFTATLEIPEEIAQRVAQALTGDPDECGEQLVRSYLRMWEDPASAGPIIAIMRSAIASDRAADRLRAILSKRLLRDLVPHLHQADGDVRTALAGTHLMGIAITRYVLRIDPIASLDREALVAFCAPTIQHYLTGPLPRAT